MSNWQLPTRKGTELFPQTTRSPVKVRFEGVPAGSPLARELYGMLRGPIDKFYRGQAQAYSLGTVGQQGGHQSTPELQMRYQNNQGSETVHVRVAKHVVEEAIKRQGGERFEWALVEFEVVLDAADYTYFRMEAETPRGDLTVTDVLEPAEQTRLRFANQAPALDPRAPLAPSLWRVSLLIDLRPYPDDYVLRVDLRGEARTNASAQIGWSATAWPTAYTRSADTPIGSTTATEYPILFGNEPGSFSQLLLLGIDDVAMSTSSFGGHPWSPDPDTFWPFPSEGRLIDTTIDAWPAAVLFADMPAPPIGFDPESTHQWHDVAYDAVSGLGKSHTIYSTQADYRYNHYPIEHIGGVFWRHQTDYSADVNLFSMTNTRSIIPMFGAGDTAIEMPVTVRARVYKTTPRWESSLRQFTVGAFLQDTAQWEIVGTDMPRPLAQIGATTMRPGLPSMGHLLCDIRHGTVVIAAP